MTEKTTYHAATEVRFDEVKTNISRSNHQLAAEPGNQELLKVLTAQNVMREALEACLAKMTPFSDLTPQELAIRLASYALSALPIDQQEMAVFSFCTLFPTAHQKRIAQGVMLQTEWKADR